MDRQLQRSSPLPTAVLQSRPALASQTVVQALYPPERVGEGAVRDQVQVPQLLPGQVHSRDHEARSAKGAL
jgi:hypothetical protein